MALPEVVLIDSARWCLANPALARLALTPCERPTPDPPPDRPSFQGVIRDLVALGQRQGRIRPDEPARLMPMILLAVFGQTMLSALPQGVVDEADIRRIIRLVVEGIGQWDAASRRDRTCTDGCRCRKGAPAT